MRYAVSSFCWILLCCFIAQVNASDLEPPNMTFIPLDVSKSEGENTEQWSFNGAEWWLRNTNLPSVSVYRLLSGNTCEYWLAQLEAKRIPCAPVNSLSQALRDTQVLHRNMVVDLKHPSGKSTKGPGNPIKLSRSSDQEFTAAPTLGQHTQEVMTQLLNLSVQQIEYLREQGIIK